MVLFAGPVFQEWYWGPLFFLYFVTPVLIGAVLFIDFLVERRRGPRPLRRRVPLMVALYFGALLLIFGPPDLNGDERPGETTSRLNFTPYAPEVLPQPFEQTHATAYEQFGKPVLVTILGTERGGIVHAFQQRAAGSLSLQDGRCSLTGLAGSGKRAYDAPCRKLLTPQGTEVFVGVQQGATGAFAFALLDDTLVRLEGTQPADGDLLAYIDSLRAVDQDDLELTRS
jgi:hypothetical protein